MPKSKLSSSEIIDNLKELIEYRNTSDTPMLGLDIMLTTAHYKPKTDMRAVRRTIEINGPLVAIKEYLGDILEERGFDPFPVLNQDKFICPYLTGNTPCPTIRLARKQPSSPEASAALVLKTLKDLELPLRSTYQTCIPSKTRITPENNGTETTLKFTPSQDSSMVILDAENFQELKKNSEKEITFIDELYRAIFSFIEKVYFIEKSPMELFSEDHSSIDGIYGEVLEEYMKNIREGKHVTTDDDICNTDENDESDELGTHTPPLSIVREMSKRRYIILTDPNNDTSKDKIRYKDIIRHIFNNNLKRKEDWEKELKTLGYIPIRSLRSYGFDWKYAKTIYSFYLLQRAQDSTVRFPSVSDEQKQKIKEYRVRDNQKYPLIRIGIGCALKIEAVKILLEKAGFCFSRWLDPDLIVEYILTELGGESPRDVFLTINEAIKKYLPNEKHNTYTFVEPM